MTTEYDYFCIVKDDSGHSYVIPVDEINDWNNLDFENDDVPDYAVRVNGSISLVKFKEYEIG